MTTASMGTVYRRPNLPAGGKFLAIHAPALPTDAVWLNVERPLTTDDLRGRIVLLDFWTFGRLTCIHALPVLAAVDRELGDEAFAVVGVHSPKYPAQRDPELVAEAVRRLGIHHPQVLDPDGESPSSFGVRGWPTLVLVGPDGAILGMIAGEPEP